MASFFFDVQVGSRFVSDAVGLKLCDEAQAIYEATLILEQLVEDALGDQCMSIISVVIRDERGAYLYEASTFPAED